VEIVIQIPVQILSGWRERWRYPELLVRLDFDGERLTPDDVAQLLVRGLGNPLTPTGAIEALLRDGEFGTALRLLDDPDFAALLPGDLTAVRGDVEEARRRLLREFDARQISLDARAREAGIASPASFALAENIQRSADAEAAFAAAEAAVELAEHESGSRLQALLQAVEEEASGGASPEAPLDVQDYHERVQACIDANQFTAARYLLEHHRPHEKDEEWLRHASWPALRRGALSAPPHQFRVQRSPADAPLSEILTWYEQGAIAPPEFFRSWEPERTDEAAPRIVAALTELDRHGLSDDRARELRHALDALLGEDQEEDDTTLRTLDDPRLIPLGLRGAPFDVVVRPGEGSGRTNGTDRRVAVALAGASSARAGIVLDARELLGLAGMRRDRRVAFLRAIGGRIDPAVAIPAGNPCEWELPEVDGDRIGVYLSWLLDLLGIEAEPAVCNVLVAMAANRLSLAIALLRALLAECDGSAELAALPQAFESQEFREAVFAELVGPLQADPLALALLATMSMWRNEPGADALDEDDWFDLVAELSPQAFERDALAEALERLRERRLIERWEAGLRADPAVARVLAAAVGDMETFAAQLLTSA
jgi:hypothetical protein